MTIEEQSVGSEVEAIGQEYRDNIGAENMFSSDGTNSNTQSQRLTPVEQLFNGHSVFVTGASGFIGRVLLEKLLRSYEGIKNIYILLRPKKNLQPQERVHKQLLKVPIFDRIREMKNGGQLLDKIIVLSGDIGEEGLGLSDEDRRRLLQDPSLAIVFHAAASVKFDEPLLNSIKFNLRATKAMIGLCKQMKNLKCLCHVSTAYVNSDIKDSRDIEEKLYPMGQHPERVIKMAELMDEELMQQVKPTLVGARPNTYTYTKSLAEHLLALEASGLPVAIVRPSIVVSAWKEPLPGWVDNLNGPTGLILAIGKGLLRTMYADRSCKADLIPVDVVVNTMIAAAHYAAEEHAGKPVPALYTEPLPEMETRKLFDKNDKQVDKCDVDGQDLSYGKEIGKQHKTKKAPPIFHCCSSDVNPITWGQMENVFWPIIMNYPSQKVLRYPYGTFKGNRYYDFFMRLIVHFLPALMLDSLCLIMGKKRQLLMIYNKLHKATAVLENFCTVNYEFKSKNFKALEETLTDPRDREQLYMDISSLEWTKLFDDYVLGARRYVLKEADQTLPESRKSFRRARHIEWAFRGILVLMALALCYNLAGPSMRQYAIASVGKLLNVV